MKCVTIHCYFFFLGFDTNRELLYGQQKMQEAT